MILKILKYHKLIFLVVLKTIKYNIIVKTFTNKRLLQTIVKKNRDSYLHSFIPTTMQPKQQLTRLIDKILNNLPINSACLVRSLIKRDILNYYGYIETINLGIQKENELLKAHAWICEPENNSFVKLH